MTKSIAIHVFIFNRLYLTDNSRKHYLKYKYGLVTLANILYNIYFDIHIF